MSKSIVHRADKPGRVHDEHGPTPLIVQPCERCGYELQRYDESNPPQVEASQADRPFPWWEVGAEIAVSEGCPTVLGVARGVAGRVCDPATDGGHWHTRPKHERALAPEEKP